MIIIRCAIQIKGQYKPKNQKLSRNRTNNAWKAHDRRLGQNAAMLKVTDRSRQSGLLPSNARGRSLQRSIPKPIKCETN